jgi:hypothetical protein
MTFLKQLCVLLILAGTMGGLAACKSSAPVISIPDTPQEILTSPTTAIVNKPTTAHTQVTLNTSLPTSTQTFKATSTQTSTATIQPSEKPTTVPTDTPTVATNSLEPGIYSSGGCTDYVVVKRTPTWDLSAGFHWCVDSVEIHRDGSMMFVVSWQLTNFSEVITEVTKRGDANNPNMYLTDNLGNRYDALSVSGEGAKDIRMEKGNTYYSTFIFRPPKPGAYNFTFHDDDNKQEISNIVLDKPSIYIYDLDLKWTPATITYYSDKWTASETDQGGFKLTHTKYPNCQVMEGEPGNPQGGLINTIDIGTLKYNIYKTQQADYSLREYQLIMGLNLSDSANKPLFLVTVPYEDSTACLEDASTILATLSKKAP